MTIPSARHHRLDFFGTPLAIEPFSRLRTSPGLPPRRLLFRQFVLHRQSYP